jgi:hypothetical protein
MRGTASHESISTHALKIAKHSTLFLNIREGCGIMHKLSGLCLLESAVSQAKRHIEVLLSGKSRVTYIGEFQSIVIMLLTDCTLI